MASGFAARHVFASIIVAGLCALPQTAFADTIRRITTANLVQVTQHTPTDFSFFQDDFIGGGFVAGTFSGVDLDGNGRLTAGTYFDLTVFEITAFSVSFSGNTLAQPFSLGLVDLIQFAYDLDGGPLGDSRATRRETVLANGGFRRPAARNVHYQGAVPCPDAVCGGVVFVPEPGIFLLGTIGAAGLIRRRSRG